MQGRYLPSTPESPPLPKGGPKRALRRDAETTKKEKECLHYTRPNKACSKTIVPGREKSDLPVLCREILCWVPDKTKTQFLGIYAYGLHGLQPEIRAVQYCSICSTVVYNSIKLGNFIGPVTKKTMAEKIKVEHYYECHVVAASSSSEDSSE